MVKTICYFGATVGLVILTQGNSATAQTLHKKHRTHRTMSKAAVVQKTIINNYGLINNGVVQKTQQSSTAISTTQDNSSHQDNSVHQWLNQNQINGNPVVANLNEEFPFVEPVIGSSNSKGLVGWWKAAGNSIRSLNNNYGPIHGGVTFVPGIFGQAFSFDGTGGIKIPDVDTLKFTKSFSISAWVKVTGLPHDSENWGQIFFRGDNRPGLDPYQLAISPTGNYSFQIYGADGNYAVVQTPVQMNKWVLLTATLDDQNGSMAIYVNGNLASQIATTIRPFRDLDSAAHPGIGIGDEGNEPFRENFQGLIDDVEVFDLILTQSQISAYYSRVTSQMTHIRQ